MSPKAHYESFLVRVYLHFKDRKKFLISWEFLQLFKNNSVFKGLMSKPVVSTVRFCVTNILYKYINWYYKEYMDCLYGGTVILNNSLSK